MHQSEKIVLSVSQFTRDAKLLLEEQYRFLWISGEVSNLRTPYSGHSYFVLKDSGSQLKAVLFKQQKRFVDIKLEDGQEVVCFGRITVYEPRGEYQLIVDTIQLQGTGNLQIQFDALKNELNSLGYFSKEIKKELPRYPENICVITSPTGAAIRDFLKILSIRQFPVKISILPVRVQGSGSAEEIVAAINTANTLKNCDIIVLCRGGGSLEDLWSFNERIVAEAIFHSNIPLLPGIGHEIDTTIADYCADFRCPTPTAVAEKIFPDGSELLSQIEKIRSRMIRNMEGKIQQREQQIDYCVRMLGDMQGVLGAHHYRLRLSQASLIQSINKRFQNCEHKLGEIKGRLARQSPQTRIERQYGRLNTFETSLFAAIQQILTQKEADFGKTAALLHGVSPLATLARGYSITRKYVASNSEYVVLTNARDTSPGDKLNILLSQGEVECTVDQCKKFDHSALQKKPS